MKKLFQKWLLLFVAGAFLLTFVISWWVHSGLAHDSALELLRVKLDDATRQVERTQENLKTVTEMTEASALAKARALAALIAADPAILEAPDRLEAVRRDLDVDQIHISDSRGILVASRPTNDPSGNPYRGFDMASAEQPAEFMPALKDPNFALVQPPSISGVGEYFQYAGVARRDIPGIVQIGYRPTRLAEAQALADVDNIAEAFRIGTHGRLQIIHHSEGESRARQDDAHAFRDVVEDRPSLCLARDVGDVTLIASIPEEEMYVSRNSVLRILVIANLVLFAISILLQRVVIRGIYAVNDTLGKITGGDLAERVDVHITSEFATLSEGINATVGALRRAIENEARRIDAELEMGRTIQASVLPTALPPDPRFRLAATMRTAKEVGGDFYDFFPLPGDRIALLIADVSGKGITAALYMMNAKALLKARILAHPDDPALALTEANQTLCANNQAHMFITVFLAILDLPTGTLTTLNAGHNPPLLRTCEGWDYLRAKHGPALGISPKAKYPALPHTLLPGDRLLLYTDGVTEAQNPAHTLFGERRLLDAIQAASDSPQATLDALLAAIGAFASTAPQADDITLLTVTYDG